MHIRCTTSAALKDLRKMEPSKLNNLQKDEVSSMKRWLQQLSEDELVEAMSFSFDPDGTGKCHEYELLKQMVDLHSQPPTPIHPRAMGVKFASSGFANDGRDDFQRVMKNRFVRPRLFQFLERTSNNNFDMDNSLASLPPEIAAMMRKENNLGNRRNQIAKEQTMYFDVLARKFQTSWGQILSLGSTKEMRDADWQILTSTQIEYGCRRLAGGGDGQLDYCTFKTQAKILRILHIVSRGRAFKCPPTKAKGIIFASWFDPTKDWFSLSTYLASRFEIALWDAFRKRELNSQKDVKRTTIIEDTFSRFSRAQICKCSTIAIARAMKKMIANEVVTGKTRDLLTYQLFGRDFADDFSNFDCSRLHLIPMVHLASPFDKFRLILAKEFEQWISNSIEKDLLDNESSFTSSVPNKNKRRKKKQRKKRNQTRSKASPLVMIDEKKAEEYLHSTVEVPTISLPITIDGDKERNKNTIIVLGVIHDIIEDAFEHLGLGVETKNNDGFQVSTAKKQSAKKNDAKRFILKKTKKKQNSVGRRAIAKPESSDNVDLTANGCSDELLDNQLTMKRSNVRSNESPSLSLWGVQSRHSLFPSAASRNQDVMSLFSPLEPVGSRDPNDFLGFHNDGGEDFLSRRTSENQGFSLFSDFFDVSSTGNHDTNFASSTAASIASSILDDDEDENNSSLEASSDEDDQHPIPVEENLSLVGVTVYEEVNEIKEQIIPPHYSRNLSDSQTDLLVPSKNICSDGVSGQLDSTDVEPELPDAPSSPPAQVSPILLSLADLGELRRIATLQNISDIDEEDFSVDTVGDSKSQSLARMPAPKRSFSREDLRISIEDDSSGRKRWAPCSSRTVDHSALSYRNAARKNSRKARSVSSHDVNDSARHLRPFRRNPSMKSFPREIKEVIIDGGNFNLNACARSESALDDHEDSSHWNVIPKNVVDENDNATITRDGATTISSIPTPHELDEIVCLREERDSYRDMCLTMAAEISKLKNVLALERINSNYSMPQSANPFGSEYMPSFYQKQRQGTAGRYVAMSDAGLNEVPMSEDGNVTDGMQASVATTDIGKLRISRSNSIGLQNHKSAGSDIVSLDYDNTTHSMAPPSRIIPYYKSSGPNHLHGLQSRLSQETESFLVSNSVKLKKQESRRLLAIERLTRLVTAIWPRAQVKAYGSQVTGLRLPSSDLDFVISLPEVHKKPPADAPGDLEGRNAINESSQKLLARKLKSESWIGTYSLSALLRYELSLLN